MKEFDYFVINRDYALETTVDTILAIIESNSTAASRRVR